MTIDRRAPISAEEDGLIRMFASEGFSPDKMSQAFKEIGFPRKKDTIRLHMAQQGIRIDPLAARALYLSERDGRGLALPRTEISPTKSQELWAKAWEEVHGSRRYDNYTIPSSEPRRRSAYCADYFTMGGVATYG